MSASTIKRSPLPSMQDALREIETEPFVTPHVIAVVLRTSLGLAYEGVKNGTIPSTRVGSKIRIPTAPYRKMLAA